MEKNIDQCATIQFHVKHGYNVIKMYKNMLKAFGKLAVSHAVTFQWCGLFKSSKESVKDEESGGMPTTTETLKNIVWVEQVLKKDHQVSCRMTAENTGIL